VPAQPTAADINLLDSLPYLKVNLAAAPELLLRGMFEVTNLTVRLHPDSDEATISIRLPADELHQIADTAERITNTMTAPELPSQQDRHSCADAVRAPPRRIRTYAPASGDHEKRAPTASTSDNSHTGSLYSTPEQHREHRLMSRTMSW
jgi:hypothetical protein